MTDWIRSNSLSNVIKFLFYQQIVCLFEGNTNWILLAEIVSNEIDHLSGRQIKNWLLTIL